MDSKIALLMFALFSAAFVTLSSSAVAQTAQNRPTLSQQAAQFENRMCGVNPNRTLFRNERREETVLYFINHAPKNAPPISEFLTTNKTKSARAAALKAVLSPNYALLKSLEEVDAMIGDRLVAKKLNWIGIEKGADELTPESMADLYKTATAIDTQLTKDKVKPKDIRSYLILQMGPVLHFRWRNEQFRKAFSIAGLDDVTMRMKSRAYIDTKDAKANELLRLVPGSGIRTSDMERIIDISQVSMFSGVKERTPELLELMAKIKKPDVKKQVEAYRVWVEQGVDTLLQHDELVAKTILAQKGMGLILLSAYFGPGVAERLMNACPNFIPKKRS